MASVDEQELQTKVCSKCGEEKELEEFSKDKRSKDGRGSRCKECENERKRKSREDLLERGVCGIVGCGNPRLLRHVYCEEHLEKKRSYARARSKESEEKGECNSSGCTEPPEEGKKYCIKHLDYYKKKSKKNYAEKRKMEFVTMLDVNKKPFQKREDV